MDILTLLHKHATAYLIGAGHGWVMYDAGWPDSFPAFRMNLKEYGIRFEDIRYLIVSHFHMDHGGTVETLKEHGMVLMLLDSQTAGPEELNRFFLRKPDVDWRPITETETLVISSAESRALLAELGLMGAIIHTSGHSEDSVSLVIDGECVFTGDLPRQEFAVGFDNPAVAESWRRIMSYGVKCVYPAHGAVYDALW